MGPGGKEVVPKKWLVHLPTQPSTSPSLVLIPFQGPLTPTLLVCTLPSHIPCSTTPCSNPGSFLSCYSQKHAGLLTSGWCSPNNLEHGFHFIHAENIFEGHNSFLAIHSCYPSFSPCLSSVTLWNSVLVPLLDFRNPSLF